jgi:hypothetical protein
MVFNQTVYVKAKSCTAISTNTTSFFTYLLYDFIDEEPDTPINGLLYQSTPLTDCYVSSIYLAQFASSPVQDQARFYLTTKTN